ncbi:hypothetical protein CONLIGDRAFT_694858 [Coniochaeta ligniaria NRRL 30616]|uniref:Uncharacterized protein n=1 Tax=Coniochaeta ligniaria NRRL 30616 TaxID=1408157 RepID=A0A1J7J0J4_9PEZI|nr:hypothetical protein CONLIGDRAFT_694858 [Coniochaeta ligniaria NRRL 30616]
MGVVSRARTAGLGINIQDVLRSKSVVRLAQNTKSLAPASTESRGEEESHEHFGLSPIQSMYMLSASRHTRGARLNQSSLLSVAGRVPFSAIKSAQNMIVQRHHMLRARFTKKQDGSWDQRITKAGVSNYCVAVACIS